MHTDTKRLREELGAHFHLPTPTPFKLTALVPQLQECDWSVSIAPASSHTSSPVQGMVCIINDLSQSRACYNIPTPQVPLLILYILCTTHTTPFITPSYPPATSAVNIHLPKRSLCNSFPLRGSLPLFPRGKTTATTRHKSVVAETPSKATVDTID